MKAAGQIWHFESNFISLGTAFHFFLPWSLWNVSWPTFFTDTAPSIGFGGIFQDQWFADSWPIEITSLPPDLHSTALLELYPIVVASIIWGKQWCRKQIVVFCDNNATVNIINKGRSSVPFINKLMRRLPGHAYWVISLCEQRTYSTRFRQ